MRRMPEIVLQDEEWSSLITRQPSYVLDERGIVQHAALAERLRGAGFDTDRPMHCEYDGQTVTLTFRQ